MAPMLSLSSALLSLVPSRWLGMSPHIGDLSYKSMAVGALSVLCILFSAVRYWQSAFYLQVLSSAAVLLYSAFRSLFFRADFHELLESYEDMDDLSGRLRYVFRWSFLISLTQLVLKVIVISIEGICLSDGLIALHVLKQEEILILIHVLRYHIMEVKHSNTNSFY